MKTLNDFKEALIRGSVWTCYDCRTQLHHFDLVVENVDADGRIVFTWFDVKTGNDTLFVLELPHPENFQVKDEGKTAQLCDNEGHPLREFFKDVPRHVNSIPFLQIAVVDAAIDLFDAAIQGGTVALQAKVKALQAAGYRRSRQ